MQTAPPAGGAGQRQRLLRTMHARRGAPPEAWLWQIVASAYHHARQLEGVASTLQLGVWMSGLTTGVLGWWWVGGEGEHMGGVGVGGLASGQAVGVGWVDR